MNLPTLLTRPSAFLPLVMSAIALVLVLGYVSIFGVTREPDEGAVAHLWQLLVAGQVPMVAFFLFKWLPRAPRSVFPVLLIQALALLAALAPVYLLNL